MGGEREGSLSEYFTMNPSLDLKKKKKKKDFFFWGGGGGGGGGGGVKS